MVVDGARVLSEGGGLRANGSVIEKRVGTGVFLTRRREVEFLIINVRDADIVPVQPEGAVSIGGVAGS